MSPHRHVAAALVLVAGVIVLIGATLVYRGTRTPRRGSMRLTSFTEQFVRVDLGLECDASGKASLAARFTPTRSGFHLYAKELPRDGISGIGRPTLLELRPSNRIRKTGPLAADRQTTILRSDILGLAFPIYPAGPVTLRQPVSISLPGPIAAELSLTYMACSERTCLPPAIDRRVSVLLDGC